MEGGRKEWREEEKRGGRKGEERRTDIIVCNKEYTSIFKTKPTFVRPVRILVKEIFRMGVEFKWASLDFLLGLIVFFLCEMYMYMKS